MTKRFKDFGSAEDNFIDEPLSFKLYGEEFHCHPAIQGKVMLEIAKRAGNEENTAEAAALVDSFFEIALLPDSLVRFNKLLQDPKKIVSVEVLSEITAWLMSEYSQRPTKEPEGS